MITGTFTVTTLDEVRALAKLGIDPAALGWTCTVVSSRQFRTVARHDNDIVFSHNLPCIAFRVRKGIAQFDAQFDGGHEWVTADGGWSLRYERRAP